MTRRNVLIRRYNDRRLYDTSVSGYVKLEDIAGMVREGIDVKVVDARSGRDLTSVVLTQIVVEDARDRRTALPLELLRQLVQASDHATHDFVSSYLNNAFELYQKTQGAIRSRLSNAQTAVSNPFDFVRSLLPSPTGPAAQDAGEIERLRQQVKDLEAQLAARRKPRRRTRTATKQSD
jgi:polyhydroxyalkanoate synthesis repressor PhaR